MASFFNSYKVHSSASERPVALWALVIGVVCLVLGVVGVAAEDIEVLYPVDGSKDVPLVGFNIILDAGTAVYAGSGSVSIAHVSNFTATIDCRSGLFITGRFVIIPVVVNLLEGEYRALIPQDCLLSGPNVSLTALSWNFSTIAKGFSLHTFDVRSPQLIMQLAEPRSGSWVTKTSNFTLYFTESIQGGMGQLHIIQANAYTSTSYRSIDMERRSPEIQYDIQVPGKVIIDPRTLQGGADYELVIDNGALNDAAGNMVAGRTLFGTSGYSIKVSTRVIAYHPRQGQRSSVDPSTNIVLRFEHPVGPGNGIAALCTQWHPDDHCMVNISIRQDHMFFLGRTVVLSPPSVLQYATEYNVSIPDGLVRHFSGISSDSTGRWLYSFSVDSENNTFLSGPSLVAVIANCTASRDSHPGICYNAGMMSIGYVEIETGVHPSVGIPTTAVLSFYFAEKVQVVTGHSAHLETLDGMFQASVNISVGDGPLASVAEVKVEARPGTPYLLRINPGALIDTSSQRNSFSGTRVAFYTPLSLLSGPFHGAKRVPLTSTIVLEFDARPQLADDQSSLSMLKLTTSNGDEQQISLYDINQVIFREHRILIMPQPPLKPSMNYTVRLPATALKFLTREFTFSFETSPEDTTAPIPWITYPTGEQSREALAGHVPYVQFSKRVTPVSGRSVTVRAGQTAPYIMDAVRGMCGAVASFDEPCMYLDPLGSRLELYPYGQSRSAMSNWVTHGLGYEIVIESGAFSDQLRPGAVAHYNPATSFSFVVAAKKIGPILENISASQSTTISPSQSSTSINFDIPVWPGDSSISIMRSHHIGRSPPAVITVDVTVRRSEVTFVITFNTAVLNGFPSAFVVHDAQHGLVAQIPTAEAVFTANLLIFHASGFPLNQTQFHVSTQSAGAIISGDGIPMSESFLGMGNIVHKTSLLQPAWNTWDDYTCFPAGGILPDIILYMTAEIQSVSTMKVQLYDHLNTLLWSLAADNVTTASTIRASIDARKRFKVTFGTGGLPASLAGSASTRLAMFSTYRLRLEMGILQDFEDPPRLSPEMNIDISTCEVQYGVPPTRALRVYSPKPFSPSRYGAMRFSVVIPQTAIQDEFGNRPPGDQIHELVHEAEPPVLNATASNPPNGGVASPFENIVLVFNEVVQAGQGSFQVWNAANNELAFNIDISRLNATSTDGHNVISDRYVSITPKTLCNRNPPCTDLVQTKTYYITTSDYGVLRDTIGNPMPFLNTSTTWRFSVSSTDMKAPEVAFVGGYRILPCSQIGLTLYPPTLIVYIFFTERIKQALPQVGAGILVDDCGKIDCNTQSNNVRLRADEIAFGDGSTSDGQNEFGLLRIVTYLTNHFTCGAVPDYLGKYRFAVPADFVLDIVSANAAANATSQRGPSQSYTVDIDTTPKVDQDISPPFLTQTVPRNQERRVLPNTDLVLAFNEDVQPGSGQVQLCLNKDATITGNPPCRPGLLSDGTPTIMNVTDATRVGRSFRFRWAHDLEHGQHLFLLVPSSLALDFSGNGNIQTDGSMVSFWVLNKDVERPVLDHFQLPSSQTGSIVLLFGEAVQSGTGPVVRTQAGTPVSDLTSKVQGNRVTIQSHWAAGATYSLDLPADAFLDLSGNALSSRLSSQKFSISSDTMSPTAEVIPANGIGNIYPNDTICILFSEKVVAGHGNLLFYTAPFECIIPGCEIQMTLLLRQTAKSIPLVHYVNSSGHQVSKAIIHIPFQLRASSLYFLTVSNSSFFDPAGHPFVELQSVGAYTFSLPLVQDRVAPKVQAVDVGAAPNPGFMLSFIDIYFTEVVQQTSISKVDLQSTNGGSYCDSGTGACLGDSICNEPCNYGLNATSLSIMDLRISKNRVHVLVNKSLLEPGQGYKIIIREGSFQDTNGNFNEAFDGEFPNGFTFQASTDLLKETKPRALVTSPAHGASQVASSTTLKLTFNEVVQAGTGTIFFSETPSSSGSAFRHSLSLPVEKCIFSGVQIFCDPPGYLLQGKEYEVTYSQSVVMDVSGNQLASGIDGVNTQLSFQVIDLDFIPPVLVNMSGANSPFYPEDGVRGVSPGQVLRLSFSEAVQAGNGTVMLMDCTPGDPDVCYNGHSEMIADDLEANIDINGATPNSMVHFRGSVLYIQHNLSFSRRYSVQTSSIGTIVDLALQPLDQITEGFEFTIVDDTLPPSVMAYYPVSGLTAESAEAAPSVSITLYFSEAVQAVLGQAKGIDVLAHGNRQRIPIDNTTGDYGTIQMSGAQVFIDPLNDFPYGTDVVVRVDPGSFMNLAGNVFAGLAGDSYRFRTVALDWELLVSSSEVFTARQNAILQPLTSGLLLYGGSDGSNCSNETYMTLNGRDWIRQPGVSTSPEFTMPSVNGAASAVDSSGCVLFIGGDCDGTDTGIIWRTCTQGETWTPFPPPESLTSQSSWPLMLSGHAITLLGGWQLLVLDGARGHFWMFLNRNMSRVVRTADRLPFLARLNPLLMSTSTHDLFMIGGDRCLNEQCTQKRMLTDVWKSPRSWIMGKQWFLQTATYDAGSTVSIQSRFIGGTMMRDDTIFMFAGSVFNSTDQLELLFQFEYTSLDRTFSSAPLLMDPIPFAEVYAPDVVTIYFQEAIQVVESTDNVEVLSMGNQGLGSSSTNYTVSVDRHALRLRRGNESRLTPGHTYQVRIPDGAVADSSGNPIKSFGPYFFTVDRDTTQPTVLSVSPSGSGVPPWTTVVLTMSEAIVIGTGSLAITCSSGVNVTLPANAASIVGSRAVFDLPSTTQLTSGQEYTIQVPSGLFRDQAGNELEHSNKFNFTVMQAGASDITGPSLVFMEPQPGRTTVPGSTARVTLWFSEPVEKGSGSIQFRHPSGLDHAIHVPISSPRVIVDGSKVEINMDKGTFATPGEYGIQVPMGVILDTMRPPPSGSSRSGGNDFIGIRGPLFTFSTVPVDTVPPVLLRADPPHEVKPLFALATSTAILLTFSETIQAGVGRIQFEPMYTGIQPLTLEPSGKEAIFIKNKVLLIPAVGLYPGEAFSISVERGAILDLEGNPYSGLHSDYIISTLPAVHLVPCAIGGTKVEQAPEVRQGAAITVDAQNQVAIVGGRSDSGVALNDVWRLHTKRPTSCSSYHQDELLCSKSQCTGNPATLGIWQANNIVWREPTAGGRKCIASDGSLQSRLGQTVELESGICPCPRCDFYPPPPYPGQMVNATNTSRFLVTSPVPRSVLLRCVDGHQGSGQFQCKADNLYTASWEQPYPTCVPEDCALPPPSVVHQDERTTGSSSACASVSPQRPLPHNGECPILCQPGYRPRNNQNFSTCRFGQYVLPACEPQLCERPVVGNATVNCDNFQPEFGNICEVVCDAGFELVGTSTARCEVTSSQPEATPSFPHLGYCRPYSCGDLSISDPFGQIMRITSSIKGGLAEVKCSDGYFPSQQSFPTYRCLPVYSTPEARVNWVGSLQCLRRICPQPQAINGLFSCTGTFYEVCQLRCNVGYALTGGNGTYTCSNYAEYVGEGVCKPRTCPLPTLVPSAVSHNCSVPMVSGANCSVVCEAGYQPYGSYTCAFGMYLTIPSCVANHMVSMQKRLVATATRVFSTGLNASSLNDDTFIKDSCKGAMADALATIQLTSITVGGYFRRVQASNQLDILEIGFHIGATNYSGLYSILSTQKSDVMVRFQSSLEERIPSLAIREAQLADPVQFTDSMWQQGPVTTAASESFWDQLTSTDDSDVASVILGAIGGILLGLAMVVLCVCCYKHAGAVPRRRLEEQEDGTSAVAPNGSTNGAAAGGHNSALLLDSR